MTKTNTKITKRASRHRRIRAKVSGTAERPRLAVYKSNKYIYAQVIDDAKGVTVASASDMGLKGKTKTDRAKLAGLAIAKAAQAAGVAAVTFDRGGFIYTGRVRALAEGAREGGLSF